MYETVFFSISQSKNLEFSLRDRCSPILLGLLNMLVGGNLLLLGDM